MSRRIKADDEEWEVQLSREKPHAGVHPLIFRCMSNSSFGWRVVEVPLSDFDDQEHVERLTDEQLLELFHDSHPFDYAHDPKAKPAPTSDSG